MRRVLSLVAVGFVLQAVGAHGQTPAYDVSVTPNDMLAAALWRIAGSTNTRIGFEATDYTRISLERRPDAAGLDVGRWSQRRRRRG